jgi:hypothetical protein
VGQLVQPAVAPTVEEYVLVPQSVQLAWPAPPW